jgi:hypothetical protein
MGGSPLITAANPVVPFDPTSQGMHFVSSTALAELAMNQKEDFELLQALYGGNDMYEQDKTAHEVKIAKLIDLI